MTRKNVQKCTECVTQRVSGSFATSKTWPFSKPSKTNPSKTLKNQPVKNPQKPTRQKPSKINPLKTMSLMSANVESYPATQVLSSSFTYSDPLSTTFLALQLWCQFMTYQHRWDMLERVTDGKRERDNYRWKERERVTDGKRVTDLKKLWI